MGGQMHIKPIDTKYKGYRCRSRLEARWLVFFDALGIGWEYEPQGFVLPNGEPYLPDFRLTTDLPGAFCEVKHGEICLGGEELRKSESMSQGGKPIIILNGAPDARRMWAMLCGGSNVQAVLFRDYGQKVFIADEYWLSGAKVDEKTGNLALLLNDRGLQKAFGRNLLKAVDAARAARFEFGECL
jgi:hypothetical protein